VDPAGRPKAGKGIRKGSPSEGGDIPRGEGKNSSNAKKKKKIGSVRKKKKKGKRPLVCGG